MAFLGSVLGTVHRGSDRKETSVRKTIVTLVAALGLLVATTGASGAVLVAQGTTALGTNSLSFNATNTTTAYALGVWTSNWTGVYGDRTPVSISGNVDCVHPWNDRFFSWTLFTNRYVSDAVYLWIGNRAIAGPWLGWDTCSIHVNINAGSGFEPNNDRMIAWLVSHQ